MKSGEIYRVPDQPGLLLDAITNGLAVTVDGSTVPSLTGTVRHNIHLHPTLLKTGTAIVD